MNTVLCITGHKFSGSCKCIITAGIFASFCNCYLLQRFLLHLKPYCLSCLVPFPMPLFNSLIVSENEKMCDVLANSRMNRDQLRLPTQLTTDNNQKQEFEDTGFYVEKPKSGKTTGPLGYQNFHYAQSTSENNLSSYHQRSTYASKATALVTVLAPLDGKSKQEDRKTQNDKN